MSSSRFQILDFVALVVLFVVVSMHFWFPNVGVGIEHDTYSTEADGKKAFYLLLQAESRRRDLDIQRDFRSLGEMVDGASTEQLPRRMNLSQPPALCLLGPQRYPSEAEWANLLRWVKAGGTLVFAARDDSPSVEIPELDIRVRSLDELEDRNLDPEEADQVRTNLLTEGNLYWETGGYLEAPRAQPLVQFAGTLQAVVQEVGFGRVVVIASDFIFSNQSLAWDDNAVLAFALVMARPTNPIQPQRGVQRVIIDESLNATATPKVISLLIDPRFRPLSIQLLTLGVLFAWWRNRAFGPLFPSPSPPRRNLVDHSDALGVHSYKAKDGAVLLRAYLNQMRIELAVHGSLAEDAQLIGSVSYCLKRSPAAIKRFLQDAEAAARQKRLRRREAADFIRRLSIVRDASVR